MVVQAESYGFNDDWSVTGQAGLDLLVEVPSEFSEFSMEGH